MEGDMGTYAIRALRRRRLMIGGRLFALAIQLTTMRDAAARAVLRPDQPLSLREQRTITMAPSTETSLPSPSSPMSRSANSRDRFLHYLECFRSD
jgi:hypothetical protein